jgi:hypothetical protein
LIICPPFVGDAGIKGGGSVDGGDVDGGGGNGEYFTIFTPSSEDLVRKAEAHSLAAELKM